MKTERICDDLIIERKSNSVIIGKIIVAVILVGVLVWFAGWGRKMIPAFNPQDKVVEESTEDFFDIYDEMTTTPAFDAASSLDYARKQLSGADAELYDLLCASFENKEFTIVNGLDGYTSEDVRDAVNCVIYDHPEFFWLDGGIAWETNAVTGELQSITFDSEYGLICDQSKIASLESKAFKVADEIIAQAENLGSDYEKALFVHDLLVNKITYSMSLVDTRFSVPEGEQEPEAVSIGCSMYGALVDNNSVCEGYAKAYQYIMKELGIECIYIPGKGNGEGHAWNAIKLGNEYYYVDVTWDDPVPNEGQSETLWYAYAFTTSEQFDTDHVAEVDEITLPVATATTYNYYRVNGIFVETYSYESVKACIEKCFANNLPLEIGFSDKAEMEKARTALMEDGEFSRIMQELGKETSGISCMYIGNAIKLFY